MNGWSRAKPKRAYHYFESGHALCDPRLNAIDSLRGVEDKFCSRCRVKLDALVKKDIEILKGRVE